MMRVNRRCSRHNERAAAAEQENKLTRLRIGSQAKPPSDVAGSTCTGGTLTTVAELED
jgi:hypothetical protein